MNPENQHILIVGGNSGIGKASAEKLASLGTHLTIASRSTEGAPSGKNIDHQRFDATDPAATLALPDSLNGVIYCPGTIKLKPFHRLKLEDFEADMQVNFLGAVRVLQQALPALKKSENASVVLFSSIAASTGMAFHASIASAKAAIEGLTVSLAAELSPRIRVNSIAPSLTDTPLASAFLSSDASREAAAKRHPLERVGAPDEISELVAFLVGDASRFITGQVLRPDGGLSSLRKF